MKYIKESKTEMVKEHKRLVKVLKSGTEKQRKEEAIKQAKELAKYMAI